MNRVISILLALCIALSVFMIVPIGADAAETTDSDVGSTGDVLYVLGDSIAEGYLQHGIYCDSWVKNVIETNGYDVEKSIGYHEDTETKRLGESGMGFIRRGAYYGRTVDYYLNTDFSPADKVVVALGINDWYMNYSLTDMYSAMQKVFSKIRNDNPDCELYYLLPFNVGYLGTYDSHYGLNFRGDSDLTKTYGYTLRQYGNLLKSKLQDEPFKSMNIQAIDMMICDAINRDTIRDGALYRPTTHTDDLHPTAATHIELAKELSKRLEAHGHLLTKHEAKEATCAAGNTEYWSCSDADCGKFFSDEHAENEIAENSWVIAPVRSHTLTGETSWTWTGNDTAGYTAATVNAHCSECGSGEAINATVTRTHANGQTVFTATANYNGQTLTDTKTVEGKILYVLGDSIANGTGANGGTFPSWVNSVVDINGYLPLGTNGSKNLSQFGLGFKHPTSESNGKIAENIANTTDFSDADIVTVALGIYDWEDARSRNSLANFYSAVYNVFSKIRSDNPNCKIYFLLPFNDGRKGNYDSYYSKNTQYKSDWYPTFCCGYTLQQFCDLIKAKFEESNFKALDVTVIDMLECEAINRDTIKSGEVSTDNFLPNTATHAKLGQELAKRFEANGHLLTEHPAAGATCNSDGSSAYWSCEDDGCGKFFSDPNGENEIAENSWIIPSSGKHQTLNNPTWTWTGSDLEGYTAAKVSATCPDCGTTEIINAQITKTHSNGVSVFTATATASNGQVFTDTKTVEGKTLYVLGDSIACGYDEGSSETIGTENSWVKKVLDSNGYLPIANNGSKNFSKVAIGFCKKKPGDNISAQDIANSTDFSGADTVAVALGINDWKETETNQATMPKLYTAMYNVFSKIRSDNPTCDIFFILPFNVNISPNGSYDTHYSMNKAILSEPYMSYCSGYTLREFADMIKSKFNEADYKALNVSLIDMLECEAINRDTIRDGALYDNLHPNKTAHALLGEEISQRLNSKGHMLTYHPAVAATCVAGNTEYWSCEDDGCGKFFSDANGENEIAENSWITPATDEHSFAVYSDWNWTGSDADGYTSANVTVSCSVCGEKEYLTAEASKSYTTESTVYTATATASNGQTFTDTKSVAGQVFCTGHSLSLQGDIGVNFFMNLTPEQAQQAKVDFNWTVGDSEKTETITDLSTLQKTSNGYKVTCLVAPAEMTCEITAKLTIDNDEITTNKYSAQQYADYILTNEKFRRDYIASEGQAEYDQLIDLTHAMLDYGSRAQIRFDVDEQNLSNGGNYTFTGAVTPDMIPKTKSDMRKDLEKYGLEYRGSTVVLLTKTTIRHYYTITNTTLFGEVEDDITFNNLPARKTNYGNEIFFELPDIAAPDLDMVFKLHIGSTDYSYSVFDYVRSCLAKTGEDANEETQALVAAMYHYNQKAKAFFDEPIVEPEHYEWNQTPELVRSFLADAKTSYDPSDYTNSVITNYAPADRSLENERPVGYTFMIRQTGTLTIGDYTKQVEAGNYYTAYNIIPNSNTTFAVINDNGRILQWGTLNPTHYLRQIKSSNSRNARDMGGWACDGGTIKYGKIIRGGIAVSDQGTMTPNDTDVYVNQLGIETEFELRSKIDNDLKDNPPTSSIFGDDIEFHIYDNYAWYSFVRKDLCRQIISDIFESVKNDKPIYLHCHAGADRTGTIAFILEAILGMSQTDMDADYELTTFYVGSDRARCRNNTNKWLSLINEINSYEGETFRDKAVNCVLGLGFTIDDINEFRSNMINGTPDLLTAN